METIRVKINNKIYNVLLAKTQKDREQGLQNVIEMDDNEGCLFTYPRETDVSYTMENTNIPLDIIFINRDKEVVSVKKGTPRSNKDIEEVGVKYVLELNQNSGVEEGDVLEIEGEDEFDDAPIELEPNKLYIIGSDGNPQAEIQGGERIFSRKSTRVILRKAKKAYITESDADYRSLGRYVFNELTSQDNRKPQYVDAPK